MAAKYQAPVLYDDRPDDMRVSEKYVPEGYKDAAEYLKYMRECYQEDIDFDRDNRNAGLDDLTFLAKDPWDPYVRSSREAAGLPCVSIPVLQQFVAQVIGDRRLNKTSIRVRPKLNTTVAKAQAIEGIVRGIEEQSRADQVYDDAFEDMLGCGIGNFRVILDYADDEVFLQDILFKPIPNPFAVVWDRMSVEKTGRDARRATVQDIMPLRDFKKQYPNARAVDGIGDNLPGIENGWFDMNTVRICEFWEMKRRPCMLAMAADGSTIDVTNSNVREMIATDKIMLNPSTGQPVIREGSKKYACMHLVTGADILAGPYELPINRLPIVKVMGRETRVGEERVRFGLVRGAKDAQRMKNYWRSVAIQKLAMAPKSTWIAEAQSVKGREEDWRESNVSNEALLIHNDGTPAPQRVDPPAVDTAILNEIEMNQQDIKDTTGLHDASLGIRSNEVSGKAIYARQQEGDVAVAMYHDNLNASIAAGGDIAVQLIPVAFDTLRTLRVVGADDQESLVTFNDPNDPDTMLVGNAKYEVAIATGPSYTTQRMMAADALLEMIKVFPPLMEAAGDLVVENQDIPGAQKIAQRLREKGIGSEDKELSDEEMAAQAKAAQEEAEMKGLAKEMAFLERDLKKAELAKAVQEAREADAKADQAESEADIKEVEATAAGPKAAAEVMALKHPDDIAEEEEGRSVRADFRKNQLETQRDKQRDGNRPRQQIGRKKNASSR